MLPAHQIIQMEEAYLRARNRAEEVHIRKRGQHGSYLYFLSRKRATRHGGEWIEEEELIAEQEYAHPEESDRSEDRHRREGAHLFPVGEPVFRAGPIWGQMGRARHSEG